MKLVILIIVGALLLSTGAFAIEPPKPEIVESKEALKSLGRFEEPNVIIEIPELELTLDEQIKILVLRWINKSKEYSELREELKLLTEQINELIALQDKDIREILEEMGVKIEEGE